MMRRDSESHDDASAESARVARLLSDDEERESDDDERNGFVTPMSDARAMSYEDSSEMSERASERYAASGEY